MITIHISTENDAFQDSPTGEIARILRKIAVQFENDGYPPETIRDANGNSCGHVLITKEED